MDSFIIDIFTKQEELNVSQGVLLFIIFVWSLIWKGLALWHAAKNNEKTWYIAILIINLVGLPEIVYLFVFSKKKLTMYQTLTNVKSVIAGLVTKYPTKKGKT